MCKILSPRLLPLPLHASQWGSLTDPSFTVRASQRPRPHRETSEGLAVRTSHWSRPATLTLAHLQDIRVTSEWGWQKRSSTAGPLIDFKNSRNTLFWFQINYCCQSWCKGKLRFRLIYTETAPRPIQSVSRDVRLSPPGNPASWWTGDFWSKSVSLILAKPLLFFFEPFL